jgi:hypothetical protein
MKVPPFEPFQLLSNQRRPHKTYMPIQAGRPVWTRIELVAMAPRSLNRGLRDVPSFIISGRISRTVTIGAVTQEERRKRPEHHVVHDYANLVSSGLLITDPKSNDALLRIAPVNSHVWHAFYMNCRKTYEFFHYKKSREYLRAQQFVNHGVTFTFKHWTDDVQKFMNTHMLHVGGGRITNKKVSTGADDKVYLAEFQEMWERMLKNLQNKHKEIFREEIEHRLDSEFRHCGTLGKEFISK